MDLQDVKAVVTGGASGLGEACIRMLAGAGARAAIFDMDVAGGEKLAAELGTRVIFAETDVTSEESVQVSILKAAEAFGGVNVAVNCAGIGGSHKIYSRKGIMPLSFFNRSVQINLIGTFNVIRFAIEQMVKNSPNEDGETGVIINTSSCAAFDGRAGQAAYAASKAGINGMTLPIARECADYGIRVVTIAPGLFATPMITKLTPEVQDMINGMVPFPHRAGNPSEYAAMVRHIIENCMLNGAVIRLDGAMRMSMSGK